MHSCTWLRRLPDMKRGKLEVILVSAEGIRHTNLIGTPAYYVIIQCGGQEYSSKVSSGEDDQVWWNEKFTFEFPLSEWRKSIHVKFRIMDKEFFRKNGFVGETIVHLGGIITEGTDRGCIEVKPAPHCVVADDDTYEGQIKIGFRFSANKELETETREFKFNAEEKDQNLSTFRCIYNLLKCAWLKFWSWYNQKDLACKQKDI